MDGVLVDTARAHFESWQVIAREYGTEITWEAFHRTFGRPNHQIIPELLGRPVSPEELRRIDRRKEEAFRKIVRDSIQPLPGVVELIRGLHGAGFRLGLGSSGPPENIRAILKALEVEPFFEAVVSGHDVERGKPAPDVFLMVAERLGVEPEACLVVEDVPAGVEAAHAAGMKCTAVTTTHGAASLEAAEVVLEDLAGFAPADAAALVDADRTAPQ
jgi:beta-phosphoglucomutase